MPPAIRVLAQLEGGEELRRALKKHEKRFLEEMAQALPDEGANLMNVANTQVPHGTGQLAASANVSTQRQPSRGRVRTVAAYLDEKAAAVHEGVHWGRFVQGTRGFKWLERAFNAFQGGFIGRIAQRLRRIAGGGV